VVRLARLLVQSNNSILKLLMRPLLVVFITLLAACQSTDSDNSNTNVCERGMEAYEQALQEAIDLAPSCETDSDCVISSASVLNCPFFRMTVCGQSVHRATAARLESSEVESRICDAAGSGPYGCSIDGICAQPGTPACEDGTCVAR
jgi:hypothetical protein